MATAIELGNGMYEVQWPDGTSYQVPEEAARQAAPESFPEVNEWAAQHGADASPVMPGAPDPYAAVEADSGMPGLYDEPGVPQGPYPGEPSPTLPVEGFEMTPRSSMSMVPEAPGLGGVELDFNDAPPWAARHADGPDMAPPVQSRSSRYSVSGTAPYQERRPGQAPAQPDFGGVMAEKDREYVARDTAASMTQIGLMESMERRKELLEEQAAHREQTIAEQNEIHEAALEDVKAAEAQLEQDMAAVSKMDMNKVFKDTSAPALFAGVMAAGIAGFLNPTGKNSVVEQMSRLVDQSAREQAANIATEKFQIQGQERALGRLESRAGDQEERYLRQRALLMGNLVSQVEQEEMKYQSIVTLGNLAQMKAGFIGARADAAKDLMQLTHSNASSAYAKELQDAQFRSNQARMRSQFKISEANKMALAAAKSAPSPYKPVGKGLFTLDPKGGQVGNTVFVKKDVDMPLKQQNALNEAITTGRSMAHNGRRLFFLIDELGRTGVHALQQDQRQRFEAELNRIVEGMRPMVGANLPDEERKGVYKQWGSPESLLSDPTTTKRIVRESIQHYGSTIKRLNSMYGLQEGIPRRDEQGRQLYDKRGEPVLDYRAIGRDEDLWDDEFMDITPERAAAEGIKQYSAPFEAAENMLEETGKETSPRELDYAAEELTDFAVRKGITKESDPELHAEVMSKLHKASPGAVVKYGVEANKMDTRKEVVALINEHGFSDALAIVSSGKGPVSPIDFREAMETIQINPFDQKVREDQ